MPLKTYQDELPSINLTPMLDIVFNLIIFFVVGTRFIGAESKLPVQVPEVADAGKLSPAEEKHVVNVYRDGQVSLNDKFLTSVQLRQELEAARTRCPGLSVIVRGDGAGTFQNVAAVLNACRQAGVADMGISVRLPAKGG
ncbi:MAG: biopolymer transporter ExbD [Pirellulaceae bacterium]|jgi:biopolymer transport protein ExbD|nr:biopolymer transporter ExbD [Pirellulaceae bacterium]MCU0977792.1 biopolymer transporter ExbD [Pirellulaceae bacterium]